jgi:hypothetical protein
MKHRGVFRLGRALAAVSMFGCSGCSLLFVKAPDSSGNVQTGASKKCTTSKVLPVLDTVFTGLEVVRTGVAVGADNSAYSSSNQPLSREADIALGVAFTALFLGSAVYGYSTTARCERISHEGGVRAAAPDKDPPERWSGPAASGSGVKVRAADRSAAPAAAAGSAEPVKAVAPSSSADAVLAPSAAGSASVAGAAAPIGASAGAVPTPAPPPAHALPSGAAGAPSKP